MNKTEILNFIVQQGLEQEFIKRLLELELITQAKVWNCSWAVETGEIVTDLFCLIN